MRLISGGRRQGSAQLWIFDIHHAPQLEIRGTGRRLRRSDQELERSGLELFLQVASHRSMREQAFEHRCTVAFVEFGLAIGLASAVALIQALLEPLTEPAL